MKAILLKTAFVLFSAVLVTSAEEISPEIERIDDRLEELRTIWRQEQAVINGYTKNRTVPVQEGSEEYHACLKASQRIQQAEAEAKQLKIKRQALAGGSSGESPDAEVHKDPSNNDNFAVVKEKTQSVEYARDKHGPKVKDLFIGMSMTDCANCMGALAEIPYQVTVARQDSFTGIAGLICPIAKGNHLIMPSQNSLDSSMDQGIWGMADENGHVTRVIISGSVAKLIFKANNLKIEEFVEIFAEAYNVDLKPDLSNLPVNYEAVTKEGVVVYIQNDFDVTIYRGTRPEDTKKAFD